MFEVSVNWTLHMPYLMIVSVRLTGHINHRAGKAWRWEMCWCFRSQQRRAWSSMSNQVVPVLVRVLLSFSAGQNSHWLKSLWNWMPQDPTSLNGWRWDLMCFANLLEFCHAHVSFNRQTEGSCLAKFETSLGLLIWVSGYRRKAVDDWVLNIISSHLVSSHLMEFSLP